jgi:hypothetical protein
MSKKSKARREGKTMEPSAPARDRLQEWIEPLEPVLARLDYIIAGLYLIVLWAVLYPLPGLPHGYDRMHHAALYLQSYRVLWGQVPYRDFFPWYGPLFHYFLAGIVWVLGLDIFSIKIFLYVVSPVICVAIWLFTLRSFKLDWSGRAFAMAAGGAWGLDRIIHCGSIRNYLPLLFIALGVRGLPGRAATAVRALAYPSVLVAFFFSPDVGTYYLPAAMVFMGWDLLRAEGGRLKAATPYAIGGAAALALLLLLAWRTTAVGNYLRFIHYTSGNMMWAYGLPMPGLRMIMENFPRNLQKVVYYLPIPVVLLAGLWTARELWRRQAERVPIWVPVMAAFGASMFVTAYMRTSPDHLVFALPPIMVLLAAMFQLPSRSHWHQLLLAAIVIWCFPFFDETRTRTTEAHLYWKVRADPVINRWTTTVPFGRVLIKPEEDKNIAAIKQFIADHPDGIMAFPLNGWEAYRVGQPLLLPSDDFYWKSNPMVRKLFFDAFYALKPKYISIEIQFLFFVYLHEDTDELMDYIQANYEVAKIIKSNIIYRRRPAPVTVASLVDTLPGPFVLDAGNGFTLSLDVPDGVQHGYVIFDERFEYRFGFLQRFSLPMLKTSVDGKRLTWLRLQGNGRDRIRNTAGGGQLRIFLPPKGRKLAVQVEFPGAFKTRPQRIEVSNVRFFNFTAFPGVPYTDLFLVKSRGY